MIKKNLLLVYVSFFMMTASVAQIKIILKLDDFGVKDGNCAALPVLDFLVHMQLKAGLGVIANRVDGTGLSVLNKYLGATNKDGEHLFEIWHHGLDHVKPEFNGTTYAYQKEHFDGATQLIKNSLHLQMHSFGAPYNANDTTTNLVIATDSNYKVTMFNKPAAAAGAGIMNLTNRVNMESATGIVDYNYFVTNFKNCKDSFTNYMVLQGHPLKWEQMHLTQFVQIIDFLLAQGCVFVTPYEYYLAARAADAK